MPEMDGFDVVATLRDDPRWGAVPVVVITSMDLTAEDRARLNGAVAKVFRKDEVGASALVEQLRDILEESMTDHPNP